MVKCDLPGKERFDGKQKLMGLDNFADHHSGYWARLIRGNYGE
jgi:hypothetical protein